MNVMGLIGILNFGGQYNHLIRRRLIELGYNASFIDPEASLSEVKSRYDCIIVSGGPWNIPGDLPKMGKAPEYVLEFPGPILGICLGHQLIAYAYGGSLTGETPEFGGFKVTVLDEDTILRGMPRVFTAWESHNVSVNAAPANFRVIAVGEKARVQAMVSSDNRVFGVQFHPEVKHTERGELVLRNFASLCV